MNRLLTELGASLLPKTQLVCRTNDGSTAAYLLDGLGNVFGSDEKPDADEVLRVDHLYTKPQQTMWADYVRKLSIILGPVMAMALIESTMARRS